MSNGDDRSYKHSWQIAIFSAIATLLTGIVIVILEWKFLTSQESRETSSIYAEENKNNSKSNLIVEIDTIASADLQTMFKSVVERTAKESYCDLKKVTFRGYTENFSEISGMKGYVVSVTIVIIKTDNSIPIIIRADGNSVDSEKSISLRNAQDKLLLDISTKVYSEFQKCQ